MRYETRLLVTGWVIWDIEANAPAIANDRWQTGLELDGAEFLMNRLNCQDMAIKTKPEPV